MKAIGMRAIAVFLTIWTPFFVFAAHRGYPIPATSLVYSAAACVLPAIILSVICGREGGKRQAIVFTVLVLLALDIQFDWVKGAAAYATILALLASFWILRRHIATILAVTFGVLLVSTAALGTLEPYQEVRVAESAGAADGSARQKATGLLIHLLLDEHTGVMGIPTEFSGGAELRRDLRDFFTANGFRLFGNAVSEYEASRNSISGILNFTAGPTPYDLYDGREPYILKRSRYFEALAEAGYDIRVYQATYMDYCREFPALVSGCYTYLHDGTDWMATSVLGDLDKLYAVFGLYLQLSGTVVEKVLKTYVRLDQRLQAYGLHLPRLPKWDDGPGPMNAMATFDRVIEDATSGPDGTAYFAHLLIPHGPYAYDRECRLRPHVNSWLSNRPPFRRENSESERQLSYAAYFEQLRCMQAKLQQLFDGLRASGRFDGATIIVHGDHGSRIHRVAARAENLDRLEPRDYRDGFATLFAAKAPAMEAGYDEESAPVSRLLARAIGRGDLLREPDAPIQVYLEGKDDYDPWTPVPWQFSE
jgi:hypothetical protein